MIVISTVFDKGNKSRGVKPKVYFKSNDGKIDLEPVPFTAIRTRAWNMEKEDVHQKAREEDSRMILERIQSKYTILHESRVTGHDGSSVKVYICEDKLSYIAQSYHEGHVAEMKIEECILEAYEKYEPEIVPDFRLGGDYYDNSLEVHFEISLPYPYEPCAEIRNAVLALGFGIIYWNFQEEGLEREEVRGWEPRRFGGTHPHVPCAYGYVDERFNETEWLPKYGRKG
jgi:hypothetical protein